MHRNRGVRTAAPTLLQYIDYIGYLRAQAEMRQRSAHSRAAVRYFVVHGLDRDGLSANWHPDLVYWWSMILSENRNPLFGIML